MPTATDDLPIGYISKRSGVAASAIRYYESLGLITSERDSAGRRQYRRHVLRRIAFIRAGQRVGLTLDEIAEALTLLPADRGPTRDEWNELSRRWRRRLNEQIKSIEQLRDDLTACIGCGCLSLQRCRLYNPDDVAGSRGDGARYLLGDDPRQVSPNLGEEVSSGGASTSLSRSDGPVSIVR